MAFKLQVIARMDAAASVTLLAEKIGIDREILYVWRRKYRSGGAGALSRLGRPSNLSRLTEVPPSEPSPEGLNEPRSGSWLIAYPARIGGICGDAEKRSEPRCSPTG